jgi:hypothetical protein
MHVVLVVAAANSSVVVGRKVAKKMIESLRQKAVDAADILNDFIGDLVGGTGLLRLWNTEFKAPRVPEDTMVNVQKICVSHLVLTLCKFVEFHTRFHEVIPSEHRKRCKALLAKISEKRAKQFRDKCIGHIWDNDQERPLSHSEIRRGIDQLTGGDMLGFLNWISAENADGVPSTVVSFVETLRDALMSEYSISHAEFIGR